MAKICIVNKSDFSIATKYDSEDGPHQENYGGPWGDPSQFSHVAVPSGVDPDCAKAQDNGQGGISVVSDSSLVTIKTDSQWAALRSDRDKKLVLCDWTQLSDSPLANKADWATYRQSLRDLPENTTDPTAPTWPTAPATPVIPGVNG